MNFQEANRLLAYAVRKIKSLSDPTTNDLYLIENSLNELKIFLNEVSTWTDNLLQSIENLKKIIDKK